MHTLRLEDISIEFPGVKALDNVSIEFESGEVHALIGANGAGKSTLFKVISGIYPHYTGKIYLDGKRIKANTPHEVLKEGIYCIYQEVDTSLVPDLTVAENLLLYDIVNTTDYNTFSWKKIYENAEKILKEAGFEKEFPNIKEKVSDVSVAQRQLIAIARAVAKDASFILFDEPTSSLSSEDVEKLKGIIRKLKERGIGVIFVSHRLEEVFDISDKITVLRDGKYIGTKEVKETTPSEVVSMMLGKTLEEQFPVIPHTVKEDIVLQVKHLSYRDRVRDVSFDLKKGEILGIYGLVGAGKTELLQLLYGVLKPDKGEILFEERPVYFNIPEDAVRRGIFLVPEERRRQGLFLGKSIVFNIGITNLDKVSKGIFVNKEKERILAEGIKKELNIVANSVFQFVDFLSGGNQQKVVVGKWIQKEGKAFFFDEPTKGIDVGAKSEMYRIISELAREGKSVIFVTPEVPEVMGLCDRALVMFDGKIVAQMKKEEMDPQKLLAYATGGTRK